MRRKKIIAGNWKMNCTKEEAYTLFETLSKKYAAFLLSEYKEVIIASPYIYLNKGIHSFAEYPYLSIAAQNCSEHKNGAFTGEISAEMLSSITISYTIVGHSERRQYFNETNEIILQKIRCLLDKNITPIFCCGEPFEIRNKNEYFNFIEEQLEHSILKLSKEDIKKIIIAYEPIWAIGTGISATPKEAQEVHCFIRKIIGEKYGIEIADQISIIYGGSVNAKNAAEIFNQQDIDGGLVGGASLNADEFCAIIKAMD